MTIQASTIRPGMLVVLKSSVSGNVSHSKQVIEAETKTSDGALKARWETERVVANPEEFAEATKLRNAARQKIAGMCIQTAFGLLCPEEKVEQLDARVIEAQAICEEFNKRAQCTTIGIYIVAGRVAADDAQAVRAINSEVRDLMETMEAGLKELNVEKVRGAADKARSLGAMLSPAAAERVKGAIDIARKAATEMKKAAEQGAAEIDLAAIQKLTASRTAFLDIDQAPAEIEAPTHEARMIDLAPTEVEHVATEAPAIDLAPTEEETIAPAPLAAPVPQFEMGE
ncbi:hypothetical protein ACRQ5Q_14645 [Bradyrhizobium sp. PMVTL-01]|uniref:hypothetical protein n=1 Tax=Bradyrhizobium sp. PMVTL-01 TaxID=3434999 RepID=UPI003F722EB3